MVHGQGGAMRRCGRGVSSNGRRRRVQCDAIAAALADELSRADGVHVPWALEMYAKRCQQIVENNQSDSRKAARFAFIESRPVGWGRDELMKHYPVTRIVKQLVKSMRQPF